MPIKETVAALGELIAAGKIKHYGLSNETTYGVCEFVRAADELGVPAPSPSRTASVYSTAASRRNSRRRARHRTTTSRCCPGPPSRAVLSRASISTRRPPTADW